MSHRACAGKDHIQSQCLGHDFPKVNHAVCDQVDVGIFPEPFTAAMAEEITLDSKPHLAAEGSSRLITDPVQRRRSPLP